MVACRRHQRKVLTMENHDVVESRRPSCSNPQLPSLTTNKKAKLLSFTVKFQSKVTKGNQYGIFSFGYDRLRPNLETTVMDSMCVHFLCEVLYNTHA